MTKDTELTKENVALILEAAGFELHRENPEGRIIFFDPMSELELQYWFTDKKVSDLMSWIRQLSYDHGIRYGRFQMQSELKKILGL